MSYDLIASNVLGSATSAVTFSSIPQTYRDLVFTISGQATTGLIYAYITTSNNTGTYNYVYATGRGSNSTATGAPGDNKIQVPGDSSYWGNTLFTSVVGNVMDYSTSDKHKTFLIRSGATTSSGAVEMMAARYPSTSAITSLTFTMNAGNWATNTAFYLYGIVS